MNISKWDKRFLELAKHVSQWSKDPSTKIGACIADDKNRVVSVGYNGFPRGISDSEEYLNNRDKKYKRVIHAEANAILFAEKDITGCVIYTSFQPCAACSTLIIQTGIKRVIAPEVEGELKDRWSESLKISKQMFDEAGVELVILPMNCLD